jgi:hypothetical protein
VLGPHNRRVLWLGTSGATAVGKGEIVKPFKILPILTDVKVMLN